MREYRWATLGCGVIAHQLAEALQAQGRSLYSVANRTREKAVQFAATYGISKVYDNIDEVFTDENVDIIYISTPHNTHISYLKQALTHGKHVLCEKSITLNSAELMLAMDLARQHQVVLAEAMTIFHMPLYRKLHDLIQQGQLGPLRLLQLNFGSYKEYNMENRFFNRKLAGGALLDIGVYALSLCRWFLSEAPDQVLSQVKFAPTGVDEQASILLMNSQKEMATISLSLHAKQPKRATIVCEEAYIEVFEYPRADQAVITYTSDGHKEQLEVGRSQDALLYEVMDMEKTVSDEENCMYLEYTEDVMQIMTQIRTEWNMKYPEEERD
ncbi:MAG: Gfo/Idh/MocA family oxidoreductase [bacterium]|nr:Gfo/Idh/MocA family oxidoreductase [bacterium]